MVTVPVSRFRLTLKTIQNYLIKATDSKSQSSEREMNIGMAMKIIREELYLYPASDENPSSGTKLEEVTTKNIPILLSEDIKLSVNSSTLLTADAAERDQLFEEAARLVVSQQQGSTSLLQRKLKVGYNRAGKLIYQLEAAGIVGPLNGTAYRDVLVRDETKLEQLLDSVRLD